MIIQITQTTPGTELERELSILTRDTHSPSGRLLHEALEIQSTTSVGYGKVYKVSPKGVPSDIAVAVYKELTNRAPALLTELLNTAQMESPHLEIHIQNASPSDKTLLSSHERIAAIALLIAWMSA